VSAGTGIRHAEYNLEQASARIFQIWITPASSGGSPAWGVQPCAAAERSGCFVALASGFDSDHDALPIRACARVLNAKLQVGESINYVLREPRLAYLVPSSGRRRRQQRKNSRPRWRRHQRRSTSSLSRQSKTQTLSWSMFFRM